MANCLQAYLSLLGVAGVSAHCLEALRWGLEEQMTVRERERWEGRELRREGGRERCETEEEREQDLE